MVDWITAENRADGAENVSDPRRDDKMSAGRAWIERVHGGHGADYVRPEDESDEQQWLRFGRA